MSTGTRALKDLVLRQLSQVELYGKHIGSFCGWDAISTTLFNLALSENIISEAEVLEAIHERLLTLGAQAYEQHVKTGTPPDHIVSPEDLAYAIRNEVLTPRQRATIVFDHGETLATFMAGEVSTLSQDVLEKLKTWVDPKSHDPSDNLRCC